MNISLVPTPKGEAAFLRRLKLRIAAAPRYVALTVNRDWILIYWHIGHEILIRQHTVGWGARVIDRIAADLRQSLPELGGFSVRTLKYMRSFAQAWPDEAIVESLISRISWCHILMLLQKENDDRRRLQYVRRIIKYGWNRSELARQIAHDSHRRPRKSIAPSVNACRSQTRSSRTLPSSTAKVPPEQIIDSH